MNDYKNYEVEDFLCDSFFMEWVFIPQKTHHQFWDHWLLTNPDRAPVADQAKNILSGISIKPTNAMLSKEEIDGINNYIKAHVQQPVHKNIIPFNRLWFKIVAVFVLALTAGIIFLKNSPKIQITNRKEAAVTHFINYRNQSDKAKFIKLTDGSLVILQPHSELRYPKTFTGINREVSLDGEAFFEVHKNPAHPFLVYSRSVVIKVLGTSFTVHAFKEQEFKVVVNTGRVMVYLRNTRARQRNTLILQPNQQVVFQREQTKFEKDTILRPLMLSQIQANKLFSFNNVPLAVIIERLEEAYHVNIKYDEKKYAKSTITASLSKLPLDEKIKIICKAIGAQYDFDGGDIAIK